MEDAEQRALTRSAAKRAPVEPVPALAGSIEAGKQVGAVVARELQLDPGGVLAEADQIAVVPGAEGVGDQTEADRLEQIGLAGAVRAVDDDDPGLELGARIGEVAKAPALDRAHHRPLPSEGATAIIQTCMVVVSLIKR